MRRFASVVFGVSAVSLLGCQFAGPSAGGTFPSGRSVSVKSDRTFRTILCKSIDGDTESVTMGTFERRKILIEPTSINVDGAAVATIPETTSDVTVTEADGRLLIAADGTSVYDGEF